MCNKRLVNANTQSEVQTYTSTGMQRRKGKKNCIRMMVIPSMYLWQKLVLFSLVIFLIHVNLQRKYRLSNIRSCTPLYDINVLSFLIVLKIKKARKKQSN